ncbi:hypothetical protein CDO73_01480 [Saccharibacillus sp. O23]|uniref:contact-dependent growth inhibition system immunity protein n=1 Tax=Saccharibacillus sp. O23 TaxID=2009338 RepID=UPI000B4E1194|nr:contact-dependent growth inhibition system immunity protein [Saccharibacillus sp. O23]OWR32308.1 hypothetical protein CDO73_01480 [Saccharibacillus sp. O23]
MRQVDLTQTIEELEGVYWDKPDFDSSLVIKVHRLRKKPICELDKEDLRLLIGQQMNLDLLLPLALEELTQNPFASGDLYIGDLFSSVLQVKQEYWIEHQDLKNELDEVIGIYEDTANMIDGKISKYRSGQL